MPKVKTTYAYKIQSIVKEFPDEFMESLCNCVTVRFFATNAFLLILIEIHGNIKKCLAANLKILSPRLRKHFQGSVIPILLNR